MVVDFGLKIVVEGNQVVVVGTIWIGYYCWEG